MSRPWFADRGDGQQIWRVTGTILNNKTWTADKGGTPTWRMGRELTTPYHQKPASYEMLHRVSDLMGSYEHSNESSIYRESRKFVD
jgi:hypothetical protein